MDPSAFIKSVKDTIYLTVHSQEFKDGSFKDKINQHTTAKEGLEIFLQSPLLSESEKEKVDNLYRVLLDYDQNGWKGLTNAQILMKTFPIMSFTEMLEEDMKRRGMFVSPTMMQTYNPDTGKVSSTTTIESDGASRTTRGGTLGVVPGAPAGFNAGGIQEMEDLFGSKGHGKQGKKEKNDGVGGPDKAKETKPDNEKNSDKPDFGADFKKNIRGAFF